MTNKRHQLNLKINNTEARWNYHSAQFEIILHNPEDPDHYDTLAIFNRREFSGYTLEIIEQEFFQPDCYLVAKHAYAFLEEVHNNDES